MASIIPESLVCGKSMKLSKCQLILNHPCPERYHKFTFLPNLPPNHDLTQSYQFICVPKKKKKAAAERRPFSRT